MTPFVTHLANLRSLTRELGMTEATQNTVDEMVELHRTWERNVNAPLLAQRPPKNQPLTLAGRGHAPARSAPRRGRERRLCCSAAASRRPSKDLRAAHQRDDWLSLLAFLVVCAGGVVFVRTRRAMFAPGARAAHHRDAAEGVPQRPRPAPRLPRGDRVPLGHARRVGRRDLFDVRRLDENRGLVTIADISGKGIEAAVNTAFVKYSIRTLALNNADPAVILSAFNSAFLDTIKDPNLFVVAFVGILDARTMHLTYASAGHSGAFLRRGSDVTQLEVTGPVVGIDRDVRFSSQSVALQPRDLLVLATDGLTEARDRSGAVLDDAGAIRLVRSGPTDPQACADELVSAIRRRSGGRLADDLALLVISINEKRRADKSADAAA